MILKYTGWTIVAAAMAVYLPSLFVYIVHPGQCWPMGILAIGFPYTWLAMVPVMLMAVLLNKRLGLLVLLAWACGWPIMRHTFAWNTRPAWENKKAPGALRIMQWNCMELAGSVKSDSGAQLRQQVVQLLQQYQPDVLLLQDFQEIVGPYHYSNLAFLRDSLQYRYYRLAPYYHVKYGWGDIQEGSAIFSKLPLETGGSQMYDGRPYSEQIVWGDVSWQGKPLRLVSTHLLSMNLNTPKGQPNPVEYYQHYDSAVITSGNIWKKLRFYQPYHVRQAAMLKHFMDTCTAPTILGIDMNSVPSSYVYHHIGRHLQDVFLLTGHGWGRTYSSRLPNLRIDYLFTAPVFEVLQAVTVPVAFSDHFPIIADIRRHPL